MTPDRVTRLAMTVMPSAWEGVDVDLEDRLVRLIEDQATTRADVETAKKTLHMLSRRSEVMILVRHEIEQLRQETARLHGALADAHRRLDAHRSPAGQYHPILQKAVDVAPASVGASGILALVWAILQAFGL